MTPAYTVYLNGYYFDTLRKEEVYGDRPEPYRMHECTLWTVYQLLRLGQHEAVITTENRVPVLKTRLASDLKSWVQQVYPQCVGQLGQLDQLVYTRIPHPASGL